MQSKTISMLALAVAFAFGGGVAHAEELGKSGKPLTAQQARMKSCNAEAKAKALKGEERKAFMGTCLKGSHATASAEAAPAVASAPTARQEKRKACGAEAKAQSLKGDARKEFVKACMKRPVDADTASE